MARILYGPEDKAELASAMFEGNDLSRGIAADIIGASLLVDVKSGSGVVRPVLTSLQRVKVAERNFSYSKVFKQIKALDAVMKKDDELAKIMSQKGDKFAGGADGNLRYYTLGLLLAKPQGKQMGEIFYQRAKQFHTLQDEECSARDCLWALECDIPEDLKDKVSELLVKKVLTASNAIEPKFDEEAAALLEAQEKEKKMIYRDQVMFRVKSPHPNIPAAEDFVEVKHNVKKGRHVVTKKNLSPGMTVIVEDPYVKMLSEVLAWNTDHCAGCLKKTYSLIPCPNCVFFLYCSEKCRAEDLDQGHRYECTCVPFSHGLCLSESFQTSFRAICKAGPEYMHQMYLDSLPMARLNGPWASAAGDAKGFNPKNGMYELDSFYPISKLTTDLQGEATKNITVLALALANALNFKTDFFAAETGLVGNKYFVMYVASKILYCAASFPINSFGLLQRRCDPKDLTFIPEVFSSFAHRQSTRTDELATVVYPFLSLLSHSCYPNAICEHLGNGKMAVIMNRDLRAGEEITISYGFWWWNQDLESRRDRILRNYHFSCECIACAGHWSVHKKFWFTNFLCPFCVSKYTYTEFYKLRHCILWVDEIEKGTTGSCPQCHLKTSVTAIKKESQKYEAEMLRAQRLTDADNPVEAIPILHKCMSYFQRTYCPPNGILIEAVKSLERAQHAVYRDL